MSNRVSQIKIEEFLMSADTIRTEPTVWKQLIHNTAALASVVLLHRHGNAKETKIIHSVILKIDFNLNS